MTGHKVDLVKLDFLSFTWSPEVLKRCAELAKQGAILKSVPAFDKHSHMLLRNIRPKATDKGLIYVRPVSSSNDPRVLRDATVPQTAVDGIRSVLTASMYQAMETNIRFGYKDQASHRMNVELKAVLGQLLDASTLELNPEARYYDAYNDLIHAYGIQFFDSLCCNELEIFFHELNHEIGVPIPAPRFTVRERRGGVHGYSCSGDILVDGIPCGLVAWGAANHGCFVSFTGQGCDALDFVALHRVLVRVPGLRITRVDLALDDYLGETISYDAAVEAAKAGDFHPARGNAPKWMKIEAGDLIPEMVKGLAKRFGLIATSGCSFYIGSRLNGKCGRTYEKGKQLSSVEFPNWVRAEGELHSKDRIIPLDVLINPDPYFAGLYPQFAKWLAAMSEQKGADLVEPVRITTFKNKFVTTRDNAVENMSRMAGRLVNWMKNVEGLKPETIINQLTAHLSLDDIPARLRLPVPPELDSLPAFVPKLEGLLTGESL